MINRGPERTQEFQALGQKLTISNLPLECGWGQRVTKGSCSRWSAQCTWWGGGSDLDSKAVSPTPQTRFPVQVSGSHSTRPTGLLEG